MLGTSKDVSVGPTAILSTLVGGHEESSTSQAVTYTLAVSFLSGIFQVSAQQQPSAKYCLPKVEVERRL